METNNLFTKLYKVEHCFTQEREHQILLGCDPDLQYEIVNFVKELTRVEIPGNGSMMTIMYMNDIQLAKFNDISEKTGIIYNITDITEDAIFNKLEKEIADDSVAMNGVVIPFLEFTLTVDIVLDKMNIVKFENLSSLDLKVLQAKSN